MPYLQDISIKNYRALRDVTLQGLQPLNVLLGSNGCAKSTLLDVFGFLYDCLQTNVYQALTLRGGLAEVRSQGVKEPISFSLYYYETDFWSQNPGPLITYHLSIDERQGMPVVVEEYLQWRQVQQGQTFQVLDLRDSNAHMTLLRVRGAQERHQLDLVGPDVLALKALRHLREHPEWVELGSFIERWFSPFAYSYFWRLRGSPSCTPDVMAYLGAKSPESLNDIFWQIGKRFPALDAVRAERSPDGRLILHLPDGSFCDPLAKARVSADTLEMLAYLVLLNDPAPPLLLCLEQAETNMSGPFVDLLAGEFRAHAQGQRGRPAIQILCSTLSPRLLDSLKPTELWVMQRNPQRGVSVTRADRLEDVGAKLSDLAVLQQESEFFVQPHSKPTVPIKRLKAEDKQK